MAANPLVSTTGDSIVRSDDPVSRVFGADRRGKAGTDGRLQTELATKRCIDFGLALIVLIALLPLLALVCLAIRLSDGGPEIFRQTRVGRDGHHFHCFKFRSMVLNAEEALAQHLMANSEAAREWAETQKLVDDPRVTKLGRILRKTSLDELPQVFNVLLGEMSLVGPRPIRPVECARYADKLDYYLAVRPGITGLWQVSGRSDCSYDERVALDVAYAAGWSLRRDLAILVRTVPAVLMQKGSC